MNKPKQIQYKKIQKTVRFKGNIDSKNKRKKIKKEEETKSQQPKVKVTVKNN